MKYQVYSPNFIEERKEKNHAHLILLGSTNCSLRILYILKKIPRTCWAQSTIFNKKKLNLNSYVYVSFNTYDS